MFAHSSSAVVARGRAAARSGVRYAVLLQACVARTLLACRAEARRATVLIRGALRSGSVARMRSIRREARRRRKKASEARGACRAAYAAREVRRQCARLQRVYARVRVPAGAALLPRMRAMMFAAARRCARRIHA